MKASENSPKKKFYSRILIETHRDLTKFFDPEIYDIEETGNGAYVECTSYDDVDFERYYEDLVNFIQTVDDEDSQHRNTMPYDRATGISIPSRVYFYHSLFELKRNNKELKQYNIKIQ